MQAVTFVIAFIVVLALIAGSAWLVRRFAGNRLGATANRGRMPRLAVIDAAAVDGRRRLVLVRRDNVEHLLMIGGPSDIVVESNIVRATPGRDQIPQRPSSGSEQPPPRLPPLAETGWTESDSPHSDPLDHPEPRMPEPPRPVRPPSFAADAVRRPAAAERRSDPLAGFTPEPMSRTDIRGTRPARSEPAMPPRPPVRPVEPALASPPRAAERPASPPPVPTPAAPPAPNADQNLAEMAQRLEAALRRPTGDSKQAAAPPAAPEPPPRPRSEETSAAPPPRNEASVAPPVAPPGPKSGFEHLEDEMASLLGRPKSPS
ncbi:flagellar biosynthetic protein FliO [Nitrobacter sp. NHB1]|uniref:flagellar biosynthetic protein FliO n=1 Tax=Nitrobacter sp. NHB1 TaxID=3119830 RepID=UPI002FFDE8A0